MKTAEEILAPLQKWLEPIPGDNPAGTVDKFDPDYEALRAEAAKLDSPRGEIVDWEKIYKLGDRLITTKAKDLVIVAHAAGSLVHTKGLDGLVTATAFLSEFMDKFWEELHPPKARLRARANALEWFLEKSVVALSARKNTAAERPSIEALAEQINRLRDLVSARFEGIAPAITPFKELVERILIELPKAAAAPPPPAPTPAPVSAGSESPPAAAAEAPSSTPAAPAAPSAPMAAMPTPVAASGSSANLDEVSKFLRAASDPLIESGTALRKAQPQEPTAYRILRTGFWLPVVTAPPVGKNGRTFLPGLQEGQRKQLETLASSGNFAGLLDESESLMTISRLNLNLQRYSVQALQALGYQPAKNAVLAELRSLLDRAAPLLKLLAADGSPLADEQTQSWVNDDVLVKAGGGSSNASADLLPADTQETLKKLTDAGKTLDAVGILQPLSESAKDARSRFLLRLMQAEVCRKGNVIGIAEAIYSALDEEAQKRELRSWDPDLVADCLAGYLSVLRASKNETSAKLEPLVYRRLAEIAPARALAMTK